MNQDTCYIICKGCKKGQIEDPERPNTKFAGQHGHHGDIDIVPEAIFLSQHLNEGYKDVDRPDLQPIQLQATTKSDGSIGKRPPFGDPTPKKRPPVARTPGFGRRTMDGIASLAAEERIEQESLTNAQAIDFLNRQSQSLGEKQAIKDDLHALEMLGTGARPDWDHYFMAAADVIKTRGTCSRLQVGAVIVDCDNTIVSTGYNGAPRALAHCNHESWALVGNDPLVENGHCINAEHAERNALLDRKS